MPSATAGALYGSRELRAAHACRELDEALALVIAVTLRPEGGAVTGIALPDDVARSLERLLGDEPVDPAPESLAPAQTAAPRADAEAPTPAAMPAEARAHERCVLAIEPGFLPGLGPAARRRLRPAARCPPGTDPEFGSVRLQAAFGLPTEHDTKDGDQTATTTFYSYLAALAYCSPELVARPIAGALCPGLRLGVTRAEADGFVDDLPDVGRTWVAFEVTATARLQLFGPLAVYLALFAQGRLARARFSYIGADGDPHLNLRGRPDRCRRRAGDRAAPVLNRSRAGGRVPRAQTISRPEDAKKAASAYLRRVTARSLSAPAPSVPSLTAATPRSAAQAAEFQALFAEMAPYVMRVVRRMGVGAADVDDVVQEVFLAVHRGLPGFAGRSTLRT